MAKNQKSSNFYIGVTVICSLSSVALLLGLIKNKENSWKGLNYETFEKYKDYFQQTNGKPLRLRYYDKPIPFIIDKCDEKTKENIVKAINSIDEISENINYVIYDTEKFEKEKPVNYISFKFVDELKDKNAVGQTEISFNNTSGEIYFPIKIKIDKEYEDMYWDFMNEKSMLTTILTHELCHTLGLGHYSNSIMNTNMDYKYKTIEDDKLTKNIIKSCYDGEYNVTVTNSVDYKICYKNKESVNNVKKADEFSF